MSTDNPHDNCLTIANNDPGRVLKAESIGKPAAEILTVQQSLTVRGITSRGIFLETSSQSILFLSYEGFKGPLNINLNPDALDPLNLPEIHENGCITTEGTLAFHRKLSVLTANARVWSTIEARKVIHPKRFSLSESPLIQQVSKRIDNGNPLLKAVVLLFAEDNPPGSLSTDQDICINLEKLFTALKHDDEMGLEAAASFFIGRGSGLTPSGDDLILGLLYCLFCLRIYHSLDLNKITATIASATTRTTKISASLIACAGIGEVDERLAASFDVLVNNQQPSQEVVSGLLGWGNSSGIDALAGMALGYQFVKSQGGFREKNIASELV